MRVLLIDSGADALLTKGALVAAGHAVETVDPKDSSQLREMLARSWDVVVMEWLASPPAVEVLVQLADADGDPPACVVCTAKATPANITAAFKAGAEDFLKKPLVVEQLRGRLGRIMAQRESVAAAAARGDLEAKTATSSITRLRAWAGFQTMAAEAVSGVTTVDVAVTKAPECAEPWLASSVLLTVASAHLECRVVVDGDRRSLELLGDAAVGSAEPDAIVDLLNEVVNNAGGNFMRAAYDEHLLVTTGLPSGLSIAHAERALEIADHTVVAWLSDPVSGAQVRVRLGVRIRRNAFVKVGSLREGMVLASDLRGAEGTVLLTAGTRVTSSTSERVRRMLDARRMVEVADTAA